VIGKPEPQGSSKGFNRGGRVIITSANKNLKGWRNTMAATFFEHVGDNGPIFDGPVEVSAIFLMPRIASLPKSKEKPHTVKPDLDKLLRGLCDSLTQGRVLRDDSLIVAYGRLEKRYALANEAPGVEVEVRVAASQSMPSTNCSKLASTSRS
jgi:Holliday junction resolvase RusA-like endonuclease